MGSEFLVSQFQRLGKQHKAAITKETQENSNAQLRMAFRSFVRRRGAAAARHATISDSLACTISPILSARCHYRL